MVDGEDKSKRGNASKQLTGAGFLCLVYGVSLINSSLERRFGGMINVRIVLSALEVRTEVPSGDLRGMVKN